ncbi:MAG: OmpA family protein [Candidatus Kapaibacterium sp.]
MNKIILVLLTLLLPFALSSQSKFDQIGDIGIYGGVGMNNHSTGFKFLPQYPSCCPNYETGDGFGISLGLLANYNINPDMQVGVKIGYSDLSALISQTESKIIDNNQGTQSNGLIRHDLDVTLPSIVFEPTISTNIIENLKGFVGVGFNYLLSGDITQEEILEKPTDVTFENGKATRNKVSGPLDNLSSILPLISLGASYDLPLDNNNDMFLSPTISYTHRFGNVVSDLDWTISTINLGVQLKYSIKDKPIVKEPEPVVPIEPEIIVPIATSAIAANFQVKLNEEYSSDTIFVKYDKDLKFEAILGYVFFEENNTTIPPRYDLISNKEAEVFKTDKLNFDNSLSGYHNILNILGQRFQKFPEVKIDLVGCNSDFDIEQGNKELSQKRAETVRDYFVNTWKLNPDRFTISARNLPETPSKTDNEYGRAENRRVEIVPQDWTIFKPQLMSDTTSSTDKNLEVTMLPKVDSKLPLTNWEIEIFNNEGVKKSFSGLGNPPESLEWNPIEDLGKLPTEDNPLSFKLNVRDSIGTEESFAGEILTNEKNSSEMSFVQKFVNDAKTEKYNLILFGYNITQLPPVAEVTLNLVKERITDKSQIVSIEGYSDMIGDEEYNVKLSYDRAIAVAKALEVSDEKAIGRGKIKNEIYDNKLPEGRFYSRSVIITLQGTKK